MLIYKIFLFLLICIIGTPGFFVFESVSVVGIYLIDLGFTEIEISFLYSCYYYPNVIFCLFAGLLIDKIGVRQCTLIFSTTTVIAASLFSISRNFIVMTIGRLILGMSAESIFMCQLKLFTLHYPDNLSLVFGVSLIYYRMSSWLAYLILPPIANISLVLTFHICTFLCIGCLIINIIYYLIDKEPLKNDKTTIPICKTLSICLRSGKFWLLLGIAFFYYGAYMSYNALAPIIIQFKFHVTPERANQIVSFLTFGSMISAPIFGFLADKTQKHTLLMNFGIIIGVIGFSCLILTERVPIILLTLILGFSYGIVPCILYRLISYVIHPELTGIATGYIESANSIAVIIVPLIFSWLYQTGKDVIALSLVVILLGITYILNVVLGISFI